MGKREKGSRIKPKATAMPGPAPGPRRKASGKISMTPAGKRPPKEIGGPPGPEPTRYGDWQFKGRVTDF
ncbi:MAG: DUF1674 domain-containing protein [Kiloniellales bacterium]